MASTYTFQVSAYQADETHFDCVLSKDAVPLKRFRISLDEVSALPSGEDFVEQIFLALLKSRYSRSVPLSTLNASIPAIVL